uniref:Cathepsin propeptide inhibitor domain-containing protein n=1 Tax=Oryza punctata TaxID=4537 RepID=A0A0E0LG60_ORYPU
MAAVSTTPALVGYQRYAANIAEEPPCKLTGDHKLMKTSDDDERMMKSSNLSEEEEEALKVRRQEWMNKFNHEYKDEAEKAYAESVKKRGKFLNYNLHKLRKVLSGELELEFLRPGNTMEVSMATALVGKQRYTTNTAGEPPACKYLTGEEEATMKTSDGDKRMEGSKKLTDSEEEALKVRFQEWMNKYNRNYKDEAEKTYRFEIFKAEKAYCKWIEGTNKFADLTREEALNNFARGKRSRQC